MQQQPTDLPTVVIEKLSVGYFSNIKVSLEPLLALCVCLCVFFSYRKWLREKWTLVWLCIRVQNCPRLIQLLVQY